MSDNYVREPAGTGRFAVHTQSAPEAQLAAAPMPLHESNRRIRGHKFLPAESKKWPSTTAAREVPTDEVRIHAHYFYGSSDWYVAGYDPDTHLAYGYACIGGNTRDAEWGDFSLAELESIRTHPYGLPIERDCHYTKQTGAQAVAAVEGKG